MIQLRIKPLSVNKAHGGRTYKSGLYKKYEKDVPLLLPEGLQLPPGKMILLLRFYFSSASSDWDNPIKPIQDIICRHYGVNDKHVHLGIVEKLKVKRGEDRLEFEFLQYHEGIFDRCRELIINTDMQK